MHTNPTVLPSTPFRAVGAPLIRGRVPCYAGHPHTPSTACGIRVCDKFARALSFIGDGWSHAIYYVLCDKFNASSANIQLRL